MNAHVAPSDLVDLNHVLNHAEDTLEPLARETGFKFEVGTFPRPAIVRGDRDELLQVIQNLVQNAFKYGERGGRVKIEAKHIPSLGRQAGRYAIAVVDWARHRARASAAADRTVLPGRCGVEPGERRHWSWARHRQAHSQPPPRRARHRLEVRQGLDLHGDAERGARQPSRTSCGRLGGSYPQLALLS